MQLKVKGPEGAAVLKRVESSEPLRVLKERVASATGLDVNSLVLKSGFPPSQLQGDFRPLHELGVHSGDSLTLEAPGATASSNSEESTSSITSEFGTVVLREIPADNNCLFTACARAAGDGSTSQRMRDLVAHEIRSDTSGIWNEAVLERSPEEYAKLMQHNNAWGGQVELSILSEQLGVEIVAFDLISVRKDVYGEGRFSKRLMVAYSGIHYDLLALAKNEAASPRDDKLLLDVNTRKCEDAERQAFRLVQKMNSRKQFTDTANFSLKCHTCGQQLKGEKEAREHASSTGHANFTENK
jgi:ubiquitin thioesterase OTU1